MNKHMAATQVAKNLATQRIAAREALLEGAGGERTLGRIRGPVVIGIDENGQPARTKQPAKLKMDVNGLAVDIRYGRSSRTIEETGKLLVEARGNGIKVFKGQVLHETDVFKGVRSLKHVRESYAAETGKRDSMLAEVEKINAELSTNGARMNGSGIAALEERLESVLGAISLDRALVKKLGAIKAEEVAEYLEPARYLSGFEKQTLIGAACAKLVAFRKRYGEWRDAEVARILAYDRLREDSLRAERDNALRGLLAQWAGFIETYRYAAPHMWKGDLELLGSINKALTMPLSGNESRLEIIAAAGKKLKDKGVEGRAKQELRNAYRNVRKGNTELGEKHILKASWIIGGGKPWYAVQELEKTKDAYMGKTIERIRKAVELLLEKNVVQRSAQLFRETAAKL